MRIAIDARELRGHPTGVGRFLANLQEAWRTMPEAQGHQFLPLSPSSGGGGGTAWEQFRLPRMARDVGADVLFAPAYSGPVRPRVPMVVAIHDVSFAAHPEWFSWREGLRRRVTTRLAGRTAARIVTISEFSKREICAHIGVDASKVVVAYPGVTMFGDGAQTPPFNGGSTVLFVGSIFERRHLPELIAGTARLARRRPEVRLEVIGDNRTSPQLDLAATARSLNLTGHFTYRHYVSDEALRRAYVGAAAFAFLSSYEGFGLTPLEAMAAGVPVILLETPVAREVFGNAACYVAKPDPELIERALERVLFNNDERSRLIQAGYTIAARYSWSDCARHVLAALTASARI